MAPWALAVAQSWLLHRLLGDHQHALASYAELQQRLDRVEQVLRVHVDGAASPWVTYRPVLLRNGTRFKVAVDLGRMDPITLSVISRPHWFLDDYYVLLDRTRPGDRVLDLGGHVGTFALAAAALGCQVACVEAAPANVALLNASVALNGFDHIRVVWGAVTDQEGTVTFFPHGPWGTIANPTARQSPEAIYATAVAPADVPAVRVDRLLERLGWDRVEFIKMDIEGSEPAALRSMPNLIARPDGPALLYESNDRALRFFGETPQQLAATLGDVGYRSYIVESGRLRPVRPEDFQPERVFNCLAVKETRQHLGASRVAAPEPSEDTSR